MKYKMITTSTLLLMMLGVAVVAMGDSEKPSAPNVDLKTGAISAGLKQGFILFSVPIFISESETNLPVAASRDCF